jgi:hypothetical protein
MCMSLLAHTIQLSSCSAACAYGTGHVHEAGTGHVHEAGRTASTQRSHTVQAAVDAPHTALHATRHSRLLHVSMPYLHAGNAAATRSRTASLIKPFSYAKSPYAPYWIAGSVRPLPACATCKGLGHASVSTELGKERLQASLLPQRGFH